MVDRPNLIARIRGTGDGPSLALCGHTDVVPADEPNWTHPPFAGHVDEEGWLWGRGAVDMKNQTATRAVAMAILARSGFKPKGDLLFIAQADEEDGVEGVGMRWLVGARPDLRVDYAIDEGGGDRLVLADGRVVVPIECGAEGDAAGRASPHSAWPGTPRGRSRGRTPCRASRSWSGGSPPTSRERRRAARRRRGCSTCWPARAATSTSASRGRRRCTTGSARACRRCSPRRWPRRACRAPARAT